mmetsp:Transcript_44927/g.108602  ORF Transcript_44927/g.108602 Transcript_44927/m.108602 type:complete len:288 (+) Transcript_44927:1385-2248(+)
MLTASSSAGHSSSGEVSFSGFASAVLESITLSVATSDSVLHSIMASRLSSGFSSSSSPSLVIIGFFLGLSSAMPRASNCSRKAFWLSHFSISSTIKLSFSASPAIPSAGSPFVSATLSAGCGASSPEPDCKKSPTKSSYSSDSSFSSPCSTGSESVAPSLLEISDSLFSCPCLTGSESVAPSLLEISSVFSALGVCSSFSSFLALIEATSFSTCPKEVPFLSHGTSTFSVSESFSISSSSFGATAIPSASSTSFSMTSVGDESGGSALRGSSSETSSSKSSSSSSSS